MVIKKRVLAFFGVLLLVGLAFIVIAASAGDGVKIVSPISGTNFMWINGTAFFNVTFINGTDIGSGLSATPKFNVTYLFNISGVLTAIGNLTNGCVQI